MIDKVPLITGGSRRIGFGIAGQFARMELFWLSKIPVSLMVLLMHGSN